MSMDRATRLKELGRDTTWDVLIIGGGASGLGAAVEAASRGLRTILLERGDFAQGTSSRSTKLVHGGVRYLEQFNLTLVLDALRERGYMLRNAPHLVHKLDFVVPLYNYVGFPYYGVGLKIYERLSGKLSFGSSELLSTTETTQRLSTVRREGLKGGVLYRDGQFDDARYAVALARTFEDLGGLALNYVEVTALLKESSRVIGITARDLETAQTFDIRARAVINATGAFTQGILAMDGEASDTTLALSQGSHFVLSPDFMPGTSALMIPKTDDGRVLFAIPWHNQLLVGTTDVAVPNAATEPRATKPETEFLIDHIRKYLGRTVSPPDVLSMWSGLRPLVRKGNAATSKLSRDHQILVSASGLVSVVGGKWTTYRRMGEDTITRVVAVAHLKPAPSKTATLPLHGWQQTFDAAVAETDRVYGSDLPALEALSDADPSLNETLHPALPYRAREVVYAARCEHARTVGDVLARRTRAVFLNAQAALECAPAVSRLLALELQRDEAFRERDLESFRATAQGYIFAG